MKIVAKTDVGLVRSQNQDSYAAGELPGGMVWAVVCDGMGGAAGGAVASNNAVKVISEKITASYYDGMSENSIRNMLFSAIERANLSVFDLSLSDPEYEGMGTTAVVSVIVDGKAYIVHVGDSRAYKISSSSAYQITKDHSVVQKMIDNGEITPEEAVNHPKKHIITRALGVDNEIRADFNVEELDENDILILCTDGLTNFVPPEEIVKLTSDGKYYEYAQRLVDAANNNGGGDNITLVSVSG